MDVMNIDANTKIGRILKHRPEAMEAIIGINPKFKKLRNPVLRKMMANRTTIAMAARVGGCSVEAFYEALKPLGFEVEGAAVKGATGANPLNPEKMPAILRDLDSDKLVTLDVRPVLDEGRDPLRMIQSKVNALKGDQVLKIVNTFEPIPLMDLLAKQGFGAFAEHLAEDHVQTYFYRISSSKGPDNEQQEIKKSGWEDLLEAYRNQLETIDVRQMEMPQPMMTILDTLEAFPGDKALYVYHKRVPLFLLPELKERNFDYRIREVSDNEVHLLIFMNKNDH